MARPKGSRNRVAAVADARPSDVNEVDEVDAETPTDDVGELALEVPDAAPIVSPELPPEDKRHYPRAVRVLRLYGYFTEAGEYRQWQQGSVEDNPADVADLIDRKAPVEEVE